MADMLAEYMAYIIVGSLSVIGWVELLLDWFKMWRGLFLRPFFATYTKPMSKWHYFLPLMMTGMYILTTASLLIYDYRLLAGILCCIGQLYTMKIGFANLVTSVKAKNYRNAYFFLIFFLCSSAFTVTVALMLLE